MRSCSFVDDFQLMRTLVDEKNFFDAVADVLAYGGRLQKLLQLGADTNMQFENGETALTMAAWNGNTKWWRSS